MNIRPLILCALLLLVSCEKEMSSGRYLQLHREKVANALALGVSENLPTQLSEEVDFCLDRAGTIRIKGHVHQDALLEKASLLDGTLPVDRYRALLADATACFDVGMYYDGSDTPAAVLVLREIRLRDHFGPFLAYEVAFRFGDVLVVGVRDFFESDEFYPYREDLFHFLASVLDVQ